MTNRASPPEAADDKRAKLRELLAKKAREPKRAPLSFAQRRLWFMDQLTPGSAAFNVAGGVRLRGALDVAALRRSLEEIVRRHEILRTTFPASRGEPAQVVHPAMSIPLEIVEVGGKNRAIEIERLARDIARRAFQLAAGPLVRTALLGREQDWVLVIAMHHIVADGWSVGVFVRELAVLYDAFQHGDAPPIEPLPLQYADFVAWQKTRLTGDQAEGSIAYWRGHLAGIEPLDLPLDRPRGLVRADRGGQIATSIPRDLASALGALARSERSTLYMVLLAALSLLLGRLTGQDDIAVGSPVAGRERREIEPLIGFFVNTLVMRTSLHGAPTFRELLRRVRDVALGAYAHQELPFDLVVDALKVERDLSTTPLFQVMFALQNAPLGALRLGDLEVEGFEVDPGVATYDLTLTLTEGPEGLSGTWEYASDIFDAATVERIARCYLSLLESVAAKPDRACSAYELMPPSERQTVLFAWNETASRIPLAVPLHRHVEVVAARAPDAPAIVAGDVTLSYGELARRSNRLARHLVAAGVSPGGYVGLAMDRSVDFVVSVLAVLQAGAAFIPLDPAQPAERLDYMANDARIEHVITHEGGISPCSAPTICLDRDADAIAAHDAAAPSIAVAPESAAYVVYTSGSTGAPKAVVIPHRGITNRMLWEQQAFPLEPHDRVLAIATVGFDASIWEIFRALLAGAALVVVPPGLHRDIGRVVELIEAQGITEMAVVPAVLEALLGDERFGRAGSLTDVVVAGEALSPTLAQRFLERVTARLRNFYGQTEVSIDTAFWTCAPGDRDRSVPIGRPLGNTKIHVLDARLEPVPVGVEGDLYVGGAGLARGYLRRPGLTADRFVPDPYGPPGARLYRSGDRARYHEGGVLEFRGRKDHQVKVRGMRVELGEIEQALLLHPAIREALVIMQRAPDRSLEDVLDEIEQLSDAEVQAFLDQPARERHGH